MGCEAAPSANSADDPSKVPMRQTSSESGTPACTEIENVARSKIEKTICRKLMWDPVGRAKKFGECKFHAPRKVTSAGTMCQLFECETICEQVDHIVQFSAKPRDQP